MTIASVPIRDVVDEFIIERGYDSRHHYNRLLNMAIRGLKELHYDVTGAPCVIQLEVDDKHRADIPKGFISLVRMYINVPDYGLLEMASDSRMPPIEITQPNGENITPKQSNTDTYPDDLDSPIAASRYFKENTFVGGVHKGTVPNPFLYRINHQTNKFEFSSVVSSPILEYMTEPSVTNGQRMIPAFAVNALMMWLHYADTRFKNSVSPREKQFNHNNYVNAKIHLGMRLSEVTYGNMRNAKSKHYNSTSPK